MSDSPNGSRARAALAALVAIAGILTVAACSSSSPTGSTGGTGNQSSNSGGPASAGGPDKIQDSRYFGLTKLTKVQLCGAMSTSEASGVIGKSTQAGEFGNTLGLGVICEWKVDGSSDDELYVGISTAIDWKGAAAITQLLKPSSFNVNGHPALGAAPGSSTTYADVVVAVGADHDPAIEYRAPTLDEAKAVAALVTPRLIALAG